MYIYVIASNSLKTSYFNRS